MKIGFVLPTQYAVAGPGNGVRRQAEFQLDALGRAGHEVHKLDPWQAYPLNEFDVVQYFMGGFSTFTIEHCRPYPVRNLVFAPILDTNEANWRYRMAAALGGVFPNIYTIPGMLRQQALRCSLIVCRSVHERGRVIEGLGIDPGRVPIEIVLNGVPVPVAADPERIRPLNLPERFLLHVSSYTQSRKNAVRLAEAVGPTGIPLVFAGTADPNEVMKSLKSLAARYPTIRLLGFQDTSTLNTLYAACRAFCLPSDHEGTGLAALEAGSYGAGVMITRNGGTRDYFGDLAYYVDPEDVSGIRAAAIKAWECPRGDEMRRHIVSNLTWDHSAQALASAYGKLL